MRPSAVYSLCSQGHDLTKQTSNPTDAPPARRVCCLFHPEGQSKFVATQEDRRQTEASGVEVLCFPVVVVHRVYGLARAGHRGVCVC